MKQIKIAIDFDGTCVKHDYPRIGEDIGASKILRLLTDEGHKLILNTMRSGEYLHPISFGYRFHQIRSLINLQEALGLN